MEHGGAGRRGDGETDGTYRDRAHDWLAGSGPVDLGLGHRVDDTGSVPRLLEPPLHGASLSEVLSPGR